MDYSTNEIKKMFLEHALFSQFKDNEAKLNIEFLAPGQFILHLQNFPGLDIKPLNPRAFSTLQIEGLNLINGGRVISGGIKGVEVQYQYEIVDSLEKSDLQKNIQAIREQNNPEKVNNQNKLK